MEPLDKALQKKMNSLHEFFALTRRVLDYLPNVLSGSNQKGDYALYFSDIAGTKKYVRPINSKLFYWDKSKFEGALQMFIGTLEKIKNKDIVQITKPEKDNINKVLYTIQQSIGGGLDLLASSNSSRKHVGNRFEKLIACLFSELGIASKRQVLQIPYETETGEKVYKCENDLILSPFNEVRSTSNTLDEREVVVSIKTTSKDRMGKIFIDKLLLGKFMGHEQKVIGIFLNDVQRKESNNISYTLVSGFFMVYTKFLTPLEGVYYLDPPPNAGKAPFNEHMKPLSELLVEDIVGLLSS